jgi:hypothetical protein
VPIVAEVCLRSNPATSDYIRPLWRERATTLTAGYFGPDFRLWPASSVAVIPQFSSDRSESGHGADIVDRSKMTLRLALSLRNEFPQHEVKVRATVPHGDIKRRIILH